MSCLNKEQQKYNKYKYLYLQEKNKQMGITQEAESKIQQDGGHIEDNKDYQKYMKYKYLYIQAKQNGFRGQVDVASKQVETHDQTGGQKKEDTTEFKKYMKYKYLYLQAKNATLGN